MYKSIELNKEFNTQAEMFAALQRNKEAIIKLKKAAVKHSSPINFISLKSDASKSLDFVEDGYIYAVINTTLYQDSHKDIHLNSIWTKTLKENTTGYLYLTNHIMKIENVIAWQDDVEAFTKSIAWKDLGQDYTGETVALIFKIAKDKLINDVAKAAILENRPVQNSVSMIYVKIDLAINSTDKQYKAEKAVWDKNYNLVTNKDTLNANGYGWFVSEAKIDKEGSLVMFGSNNVTPILDSSGAAVSTPKIIGAADIDTPDKRKTILLNLLNL